MEEISVIGDTEKNRSSAGEHTGEVQDRERKRKAETFDAADPDRHQMPSRERHPKDYKFLPQILRDAFSEEEYSKLIAALPQWETTLESYSAESTFLHLNGLGFEGGPVKAQAIKDYLHPTPLAKQLADAVSAGLHEEAIAVLERVAEQKAVQEEDDEYVRPRHFPHSWARDEWQQELFEGRMSLDGLAKISTIGPSKRVMAMWSGTGNGKSHRLMELQDFHPHKQLEKYEADSRNQELTEGQRQLVENVPAVDCFIYVTYNKDQVLKFDRDHVGQAIVLRIMLRSMGATNNGCDNFLLSNTSTLEDVDEDELRILCVEYFRAKKNAQHVGIAVDELRMLLLDQTHVSHPCIPLMFARIGWIAAALEKAGVSCTSIVSSLTSGILSSESGRPVHEVYPPPVGVEGIKFIIEHAELPAEKKTAKNSAMVLAAAGTHFRSAIVAVDVVASREELTPVDLFKAIQEKIDTRLQPIEREYIRQHVLGMMETGDGVTDHRERFIDQQGAVAPVFVLAAFHVEHGCQENMHPAEKMFEVSAHAELSKQLQQCAMYYDSLRALYNLPVVPSWFSVENKPGDDDFVYFRRREYRCDEILAKALVCHESILEVDDDDNNGFHVVPEWVPATDQFMLPSEPNNMPFDRACVAFHPVTRAKWLVIYRDGINARELLHAARCLDKAATQLKEHLGYPVLCVLNAVVASDDDTVVESNLNHPFVLVGETDLDAYYTPTFAIPMRGLLSRHKR